MANSLLPPEERNLTPDQVEALDKRRDLGHTFLVMQTTAPSGTNTSSGSSSGSSSSGGSGTAGFGGPFNIPNPHSNRATWVERR